MAHAAPAAHVTHPAAPAATAGAWGNAHRVPGLMALNEGHSAGVNQVSCASPGNCAATGDYTDAQDHTQPFVASEMNGTWGLAIQVPGIPALSKGGGGLGSAVSCASPGNCDVTGVYLDAHGHQHAFVADENNGTWHNAHAIPGLGKLNPGGTSSARTMSCALAGNCTAGGFYEDATISFHAFVADETNGQWGRVHTIDVTVTGVTPINEEQVTAVSCASAGTCAATGNAGNA